jgi:hypothetical protein
MNYLKILLFITLYVINLAAYPQIARAKIDSLVITYVPLQTQPPSNWNDYDVKNAPESIKRTIDFEDTVVLNGFADMLLSGGAATSPCNTDARMVFDLYDADKANTIVLNADFSYYYLGKCYKMNDGMFAWIKRHCKGFL